MVCIAKVRVQYGGMTIMAAIETRMDMGAIRGDRNMRLRNIENAEGPCKV